MTTVTLKLARLVSGKRLFDVVFSSVALVVLMPILGIIAIILLIITKGNVFFVQERLGFQGKVFKCLKFRTMVVDAEKKLEELLKENSQLKNEWKKHQKLKDDPRIFSFGKFLRRSSLDELPQLWNVLKGDLSLVGPRPYTLNQKSLIGRHLYSILSIRPGITGLWQTSGRSKTTFDQRVALDLKYLECRSFRFDLYLLLKTIPTVLFDDAY